MLFHYSYDPFSQFIQRKPFPFGYPSQNGYYQNYHYSLPYYSFQPTYRQAEYFSRQYPDVDPTLFNESAISMQNLMMEASLVLNKIAESKQFAQKVMTAAQESHLEELEQLIKSTGIKSDVDTSFNPNGINLKLSSKVDEADCCHLTVSLRWR